MSQKDISAIFAEMADITDGACASMPVMCVAIGRRLGYPLKQVYLWSYKRGKNGALGDGGVMLGALFTNS